MTVVSEAGVCARWGRGFHREGVQHLAFSPVSGSRLCSVGMDAQHCLALWDWASRQLLFTSPTTQVRRHSTPSTRRRRGAPLATGHAVQS